MAKLRESACELILKEAGGAVGDKGFIGTDWRQSLRTQATTTLEVGPGIDHH